jgi:hypothetical protein
VHLETLIHEVFEKATTQHHFINMYADLCSLLHTHFAQNPITDDPKMNFKKILLNACQASFERHLTPPSGLEKLDDQDRTVAEQRYKMRMIGNIRFVGALFVRKMLASKVMFAIIEEFFSDPTPEALESLAALLTAVGPTFDVPDWPHRPMLTGIFHEVQKLIKQPTLKSRVRCLLKDVLDLRANQWQDRKPKKMEGPSTLEEVALKAAAEEGGSSATPTTCNGFTTVTRATRSAVKQVSGNGDSGSITRLAGDLFGSSLKVPASKESSVSPQKTAPTMSELPKKRKEKASEERFDKDACRSEISKALVELRLSHDVKEAIVRIAGVAVPVSQQQDELCELLVRITEEGSQTVRKAGFDLLAGLFSEGHWKPSALRKGLETFKEELCIDLKVDVPGLPKIVTEELHPAFAILVKNGLLQSTQHDALAVQF